MTFIRSFFFQGDREYRMSFGAVAVFCFWKHDLKINIFKTNIRLSVDQKSNYQLICKLLMHKSHQCLIMVAKEDEIQMQSKTIPQKINELYPLK